MKKPKNPNPIGWRKPAITNLENRVTAWRGRRYKLNKAERDIISKKETYRGVYDSLVLKNMNLEEAFADNACGKAELMLFHNGSMPLAFTEMVRRLLDMCLASDRVYKDSEMMKTLGISKRTLLILKRSEEFQALFNEQIHSKASDPIPMAIQARITEELLPEAYMQLAEILKDSPPSTKLKAILEIFRQAGIEPQKVHQSDRGEAVLFLQSLNIKDSDITIQIPQEYQKALESVIVDGTIVE